MNALAPISLKLDPLVRRLASSSDGEVIACVRAIERQLAKTGASWHDLADKLTSAPETPAQSYEPPAFYDYLTAVEWLLANDCGELTVRDINFCKDMRAILYRWPPKPKQAAWIRSLVERLGGQFDG
jgi:hypothetical protein